MSSILYKYCSINEYTIKNLINNQLYFNAPKMYNDPYEGFFKIDIANDILAYKFLKFIYQHRYKELIQSGLSTDRLVDHTRIQYINEYLNDMRICCFSYVNDSMLMWAHYSKQHEGICMAFDANDEIFRIGSKVNYSEHVSVLHINESSDISSQSILEVYDKIVSTKHIDWSYEKEYRVFKHGGKNTYKYRSSSIRAIYFGLRCSDENISEIKRIMQDNTSIQYYRADLKKDSYKIRFISC